MAFLDAGGTAIYVSDGGVATRVIGTGDTLNGSTVTSLDLGPGGLNDAGQVAFRYRLTNNTFGVAVANVPVPEPGSAAARGLWHRGPLHAASLLQALHRLTIRCSEPLCTSRHPANNPSARGQPSSARYA